MAHVHSEGVSVVEATGQRPSMKRAAEAKPVTDETADTDQSMASAMGPFGNMDDLMKVVDDYVF
jgi:hypothetical protein